MQTSSSSMVVSRFAFVQDGGVSATRGRRAHCASKGSAFVSSSETLARSTSRPQQTRPKARDGGCAAAAVIRLLKFDPKRVSVRFAEDTCRTVAQPGRERRYTLTHNDLTRHLTLSVASDFNGGQTNIWYTRLLRDEVLAEWREDGLHVHCNVSVEGHWWISWAKSLRAVVFRQKLPLVLDTLRYAERDLLMTYPQLLKAPVYVNFHGDGDGDGAGAGAGAGSLLFGGALRTGDGDGDGDGRVGDGKVGDDATGGGRWTPGVRECWGPLGSAGARGRGVVGGSSAASDQRVSEEIEAFSRARDLWAMGGGDGPAASAVRNSAFSAAAAAATASLDDVVENLPQQRNGGGGGGGGGMAAAGLDLAASRARSFAKNSVSVSSSSVVRDEIDALASPAVKRVISR